MAGILKVDQIKGTGASGNIEIPTGYKLVAADGGAISAPGNVLQVLYTQINRNTQSLDVTSQGFVDLTGYSLTITPSSASNKILIQYNIHIFNSTPSTGQWRGSYRQQIVRDSTVVYPVVESDYDNGIYGPTNTYNMLRSNYAYLDSPNTTSAITYKVQVRSRDGDTIRFNAYAGAEMWVMEIAQ